MIPVCEQCGQPINIEYEEWTVSEDNEPIHIDCIELRNGGGQVNEFRQHLKKYDEYEAKSQAFDEIVDCLEKQVAYGLKDSEVLSEIDYLIRETFHNSKNNIYRRTEERSE